MLGSQLRRLSILVSATLFIAAPAHAQLVIVTNQAEFDAAVAGAAPAIAIVAPAGTIVTDGTTYDGSLFIGAGTALQSSGATTLNQFLVGSQPGGTGSLNVTGGNLTVGAALHVGDFSGVGTVNQTGGTVALVPLCGNPASCVSLNIGNQGGSGTYNISGGALELNGGFNNIGRSAGSNPASEGTLNISGGLVVLRPASDPAFGVGRLIIGSRDPTTDPGGQGEGTINQTGGILRVEPTSTLFLSSFGNGTYNLLGGTLQIGGDSLNENLNGPGTYAFNLGGGTIQVIGSALSTSVDATLLPGTFSTIDTNGLDATWNGVLSGGGGLISPGAGTLLLNAANTYTGGTIVSGGTLMLGPSGSLAPTGALQVDAGATFDLNSHIQTVGTFSGAGSVLLGSGQLTTNSADSTVFSGGISGTGSLVKDGSGTLVLSGTNTFTGGTTVNAGTLVVNGSVASPVNVVGGTLSGDGVVGSLTVASGATLAPGTTIGTLHVAGNATLASGSIYQIQLAGSQSDLTAISGVATINGGTVVLQQLGPLSLSAPYTILTAAGGRTGVFDGVTGLDLTFLTPALAYDANNVFLQFVRSDTALVDVALTRNQRAVAGALDQFPLGDPLGSIILTGTAAGAREAFDALSGELHASAGGMLLLDSIYVRKAILDRLTQASYSGGVQTIAPAAAGPTTVAVMDSGSRMALGAKARAGPDHIGAGEVFSGAPASGHGLAFWTRGFGAWGELASNGNAATADRALGGFVSGVDAGLGGGWRAGLATGYIQSHIGIDARFSSADIDSYVLAGYAGGFVAPVAIRSGGAWTWHSLDTTRNVIFPGFSETERASYTAGTGQLFGEIAHPMRYGSSAWEPFAGLAYVHVGADSFTETRGGLAALSSGGADHGVGISLLGVRAATTLPVYGVSVTPHGSIAWQYAFGDIEPAQTLAFASNGIAFGIHGVPIAESSALVETGLSLALDAYLALSVNYMGQFAPGVQDNAVQARFSWRF